MLLKGKKQAVRWTFGEFVFDPAKNILEGPFGKSLLEPKASSLLWYFVQNPYRDISRDELLEKVWDGQIVSDGAINRVVVQLRKNLNDDGKIKHLIVTAPKVGYRFVGAAEPVRDNNLPTNRPPIRGKGLAFVAGSVLLLAVMLIFASKTKDINARANANLSPMVRMVNQQFAPSLAHDTEQIVFSQKTETGAQLYWAPQPTTAPIAVGAQNGTAEAALWAPQDKMLVYRFITNETCAFHLIEFQNGHVSEPKTIYECTPSDRVSFAFSEDGSKLYFSEQTSAFAPYHIYGLDIVHQTTRRLSQPVATGRGNFHIERNPQTGKLLLLSDTSPGQTSLYELDTKQNSFSQLTAWPHKIDFAVWGHQPDTIVHPGAHPSYQLIETNFRTQSSQILVSDSRRIKEPARINNGRDFLFASYLQNRDIFLDGRPMAELNSSVMDYLPSLSRSGIKLAFISKRTGESKLWLKDLETGSLTMLDLSERGQSILTMDWSFDDQMLLITTSAGLLIMDLETATVRHRLNPELPVYVARWSGADEITYSLRKSGRWQLYRHNIYTGETTAENSQWAFTLTSADTAVYLDQNYQVFDLNGQPLNVTCATSLRLQELSMRLLGNDLFCINRETPTDILVYKNLNSLEVLPNAISGPKRFSVSKTHVASTHLTSAVSDIMRTNF